MAVLNEEQSMLRDAAKSWTQEKRRLFEFARQQEAETQSGLSDAKRNEACEKPYRRKGRLGTGVVFLSAAHHCRGIELLSSQAI